MGQRTPTLMLISVPRLFDAGSRKEFGKSADSPQLTVAGRDENRNCQQPISTGSTRLQRHRTKDKQSQFHPGQPYYDARTKNEVTGAQIRRDSFGSNL